YRPANTFVMKALKNAYIGRKLKKRDFRKLWIQRINAAARMNGLKLSGVEVNRKMLSEMAIQDPEGFAKLAEVAKAKLA
ncbi:50S ribosomal protein L20, partial [Clostridioides difficile]|nr:50S ribosomal protein L20 [Clostridioides difficile]